MYKHLLPLIDYQKSNEKEYNTENINASESTINNVNLKFHSLQKEKRNIVWSNDTS